MFIQFSNFLSLYTAEYKQQKLPVEEDHIETDEYSENENDIDSGTDDTCNRDDLHNPLGIHPKQHVDKSGKFIFTFIV